MDRGAQDKALAQYIRRDVYPYSAFYRARLDESGLRSQVTRRGDLARLRPTVLDEVEDPGTLVLRPEERTIQRYGEPAVVWKVFWSKLLGRQAALNDGVIDPAYKPVHWHFDAGLPIASSAEDLERLAELGRRWLELAGLTRADHVVGILPPGPNRDYWELVLGCRRAGVSSLHLPPVPSAADLEAANPSVLAGRPDDLSEALMEFRRGRRPLATLHTLLAVGEPLRRDERAHLQTLAGPDVAIVVAWAASGARALWSECRGGGAGYHTAPDTELVETDQGTGELLWSAIGWKGSVFLRLATRMRANIDESPCPRCRRTTPRVVI